jgi:hypothetical protein
MLEKVKLAWNRTDNTFDTEITDLISSAELDLGIAGVVLPDELTTIAERAITLYCLVHLELEHGDPSKADKFKIAYDENKAQLSMATGYTVWG